MRSSHADKRGAKAAKAAKASSALAARGEEQARANKARAECVERHVEPRGNKCAECAGVYSTVQTFAAHVSRGVCLARRSKAQLRSRNATSRHTSLQRRVEARRENRMSAEREEQAELKYCEFSFREAADADAIEFCEGDGASIVVKFVDLSRRDLACTVLPAYSVVHAWTQMATVGPSLAELTAALATVSPNSPVYIKFSKPLPRMPSHGFARKRLAMKSRTSIPKEAIKWLEDFCSKYEAGRGSSPRAHTLRTEMVKVGGLFHTCKDGSMFVQDEGRLFNWLKKRYTTQKSAGLNLALFAAAARAARLQQGGAGAGAGPSGVSAVAAWAEDDDEADEAGDLDYEQLRVPELKELLRGRKLRVGGSKAGLILRLRASDGKQSGGHAAGGSDEENDRGNSAGGGSDSSLD